MVEASGPNVSLSSPTGQRALRFMEAKKLIAAGHSLRTIARMLKLNRKTVIRYQHYEQYPARHQPVSRQSTVLPWRDYLVKQWNEGEHRHRHLWQQIKLQGFTGHPLSVYRFLAQFKGAEAKIPELEIKNWTPNRVQFLLTKADKDLQPRQQEFLAVFFEHWPLAITARKLALEFRALLEEKKAELLPTWICRLPRK